MSGPLPKEWLQALSLSGRRAPDLFLQGEPIADVPHGAAMRLAFSELGLAAIHCIQQVPAIAFLVLEQEDAGEIGRVHGALWNQGLVSLLFVIVGDRLRAYTLTRKPIDPERSAGPSGERDRRLLDRLHLVDHALQLQDLVSGVESGRLFQERYPVVLDAKERIDGVLLKNLMASHRLLQEAGLGPEEAQALLMQAMFIAYLEDRTVIKAEYFQEATGQPEITGFRELLRTGRPDLLLRLFGPLNEHFNGDLFHSPCAFGRQPGSCALSPAHLETLSDFIWGDWEMDRRQRRFWSYQFRYIPVELISAVYDRMLAEDEKEKKAQGAFYTPMFLADLVVDQAWEFLTEKQRHDPEVLDPACGSGVFLVRLFERLVEHRRSQKGNGRLPWHSLKAIVNRLHGWDKNPMAVRIAVFSLYLALMEQREPREIQRLMDEGKMLPPLWGETLREADFFAQPPKRRFDLTIGNPPWSSRRHKLPEAIAWCNAHERPIPEGQSAWGFAWKASEHTRDGGLIAFLLPAMGFLHNDASVKARRRWLHDSRMERLINFADLSFLLFEGPKSPTVLAISRPRREAADNYRFEYWRPKADLNIQTRRLLTMSHADRGHISLNEALLEPGIFKQRLWMGNAETRLFDYLRSLPRLNSFITRYGDTPRGQGVDLTGRWIIGQGFSDAVPKRWDEPGYAHECPEVVRLPFLDVKSGFRAWVLPFAPVKLRNSALVYRNGYIGGYYGPHILIPQGVVREDGRIRAAYDDQNLCFSKSIQSITFSPDKADQAKLLTAVLNSQLAGWFLLHETSALGVEIAKAHEKELFLLPFPNPDNLDSPGTALEARKEIIAIMDGLLKRRDKLLDENHWPATIRRLDELVYAYYGLSEEEIAIVRETFAEIIPAIQPNKGKRPSLWNNSGERDWSIYLEELKTGLGAWMQEGTSLHADIVTYSADGVIVRVHLGDSSPPSLEEQDWNTVLDRFWSRLDRPISRNLQIISDLRLFDGDDLYLFKPRKRRFWLRTSAMNDADSIAAELFSQAGG